MALNVPKKAVGEASSTQIWEGETVMPGDWSGNVQMTDDAAKAVFADAQVGQVIRVAEGWQRVHKVVQNSVGADCFRN